MGRTFKHAPRAEQRDVKMHAKLRQANRRIVGLTDEGEPLDTQIDMQAEDEGPTVSERPAVDFVSLCAGWLDATAEGAR